MQRFSPKKRPSTRRLRKPSRSLKTLKRETTMSNQEFYEKMQKMVEDHTLFYAEKKLPEMFVRVKIGGHFMATSVEHADFLRVIQEKIAEGQFFTQPQLDRFTGKSCTFSSYEVERGKYVRIKIGKFKLYTVKDW